MSAGLLAVYAFGPETELGPYVHYGILSMRNRGHVRRAYVYNKEGVQEVDPGRSVGLWGNAAIGCVWAQNCCTEGPDYVLCKMGNEDVRPGGRPESTTYVALTDRGEMYLYRSDLWHLALGAYGFDLALAATETATIDVLGGDLRRSLKVGELVKITQYGVESTGGGGGRLCALEAIYSMRFDSKVDGVPIAELREALASLLAPVDADVIAGVPETGAYYAALLATKAGRPYVPAFVQTTRGRSALLDDMRARLSVVQLKANPVEHLVRGKRVLLVDDSVISGLTLKAVVQVLRRKAGAREISIAVASPPLRSKCPYGVKMPEREAMMANVLTEEEARMALEADGLKWPSVDDLLKVAEARGLRLCAKCFLP